VEQFTQLYDALPLASKLPNEGTFHEIIPEFLNYDYGTLENSTLECVGSIGTLGDFAVFTLYDIDTFQARAVDSIRSPDDPAHNGDWARSDSVPSIDSDSWTVYRVEVAGGVVPPTCANHSSDVVVEYVAEYWLYR
jgi:hypothetical protein